MAANADAAAETEVEGEEGAPKKKLPLKLIAMAAAGFLVVAGGGTGAYFMFFGKKKHEEEKAHAPIVKPIAFLDLPDVMVNLATAGSDRTQYLKVKIVLELPEQAMAAQITPVIPRVMDTFQTYLRELRPTDLEGSAGLYRMKEELTRRVNAAIEPARVNAVLFKEMLVQ
jgi:flagellar protein FliL